jgi:GntR family transcriptional regulator, transcriptional repressor for pyruvate dehydrogenase complex
MAVAVRRSPVRFKRLQQPKAHEYVAEQIRRHIALRLIAPGESLPSERELAAMFGVGRPTIQLALKELAADRLVESRRGRRGGTFVSEPAEDTVVLDELISRLLSRRQELEELLDYRRGVEPVISRLAAGLRRRIDLSAMRAAIRGMGSARDEPDYMRFDTEFHLAVAGATQNRFLVRSMEDIRLQLNDALSLLPESETWHRHITGEHEKIFEAIEAHDAGAAEEATVLHVDNSDRSVRATLAAIRRRRSQ